MSSSAIKTVEHGRGWILALVLLCGGLAFYKSLVQASTFDPAYLLGQTLVHALLIFGVFYLVFLRNRGASRSLAAFFAIWMSLFGGGLVAARSGKSDAAQVLSSMQAEVRAFAEASTDADGMPVAVPFTSNTRPAAGGSMGQAQELLRDFLSDVISSRNNYLSALTAMGWEGILDADRLKADTGMQDSLAMLAKAEANIDTHEAEYNRLVGGFKDRIYALDLSQREKAAMWAGAQTSMAQGVSSVQEQFRLERATVQEFRKLIDLLGRTQWEAQDDQVMFYTDEDVATFNGYFEAINRNTARQEELQAAAFASFDGKVERLKRELR